MAQSAASAVSGSETIERALARLGGSRGGAASYLGFALVFAGALVAFAAAGQVAAARAEEAEGHLDNVLVRPVSRHRWLVARLGVGAAVVVVVGVVAGLASWAGAASQHSGVGFGDLVKAGINITPPGLFVLGVGGLLFGIAPRRAPAIAYAVVTWSFVVQLVAAVITTNRVLLGSSVFHHIAPAPAADPNWPSALALAGIGVVAAFVGVMVFRRRDVVM